MSSSAGWTASASACARGEPIDRIQPRNVFQVIDEVVAERRKEGATRLGGFFSRGGGR